MLLNEEFKNKSQFLSYLDEAYKNKEVSSLHCSIIIPKVGFSIEELERASYTRGLKCRIEKKDSDFYKVEFEIRTRGLLGYLIDFKNCWLFFNGGSRQNLSVVESFVNHLFPLISYSNLPSNIMMQLIEENKDKYETIIVTEGILCKKGETIRDWKIDPINYSISTLEREAKKQDAKWTGLSLTYMLNGKEHIKARVYEKGLITFYSGSFLDFYESMILTYSNKSIEYGEFFKDKERKSVNGEIRINPIKYKFKKEISLDELNKIKNKILKRYMGGVTSFGNPLLMMQFSDVNDGSSYDLYAYHNTIEVVPLDKASSASFSKLASFISDNLPLAEMVGGLNIGHT